MAAAKRKSIAKLCLALGLFILAGVFRQMDRLAAPLPSAVCFLLTNLIYIGLAMSWGFSISRRILHCDDRRWLLLGCAMTVLWLFLRTVKYRFFNDCRVVVGNDIPLVPILHSAPSAAHFKDSSLADHIGTDVSFILQNTENR